MQRFRRFAMFLNLQPREERLTGLLVLLSLTLELAFVLIQSMAFGIFLSEYGARALPYSYIVTAILASLAALVYIKLSQRVSFPRALTLNLISLGAFTALVWLGLKSAFAHRVSFLLPPLFQIVLNLGTLVIWQQAGRQLNLQQAKRLFPLINAGGWLADIIGGLLILPLVDWMGAANLLLPAIVLIGLGMLTLKTITRTYPVPQSPASPSRQKTGRARPTNGPFRNHYVLLIFGFIMLWWIVFFFLDNIFADRAAAQFTDVNQLTAFRGQLLAITGIVAIFCSLFLTSRIIRRFGLRAGLLGEALPVTVLVGLLAITGRLGGSLVIVFALATLAKLVNVALGFSVSQSAYLMLYQPLPNAERDRVQATAEGVLQPIASGFAGILLLTLTSGLSFNYLRLSYVYLGFAAGLIIVISLLSGGYLQALTQAITRRRLGDDIHALADPASIALLKERLRDTRAGIVIYAMTRLEALDKQIVLQELPSLVRHSSPEVRREALARIESMKLHSALDDVQNQYAVERFPMVKESALQALGALAKEAPPLVRALDDSDIHCLRGALTGLLKYGNDPTALRRLKELLASSSAQDRTLALEVLGKINRSEFYPDLIHACDSPETSRIARLALVSLGVAALPEIEAAFCDPAASRQRLSTLAKALGQIGGTQSQSILLSRLSTPDHELRSQILHALSQSGYRAQDSSEIQRSVQWEVEQAAWVSAVQVQLGERKETALLNTAFTEFLAQIRERVLLLVSFAFDRDSIRRVAEALRTGSGTQTSYALEIVEVQLPEEWKKIVLPLLDDLSPSEREQRLAALFPQPRQNLEERLCAILENFHYPPWVRACAAYTSAHLALAAGKGEPAMLSTVEKVLVLKTVAMFGQTPDHVLADVADLLEEIEVAENETIFQKGEPGDSMYIIVDGKVRVHTGERLLNYLGESDVFGEMALLDPEPRLASVTTVEPTRLLRLDQSPFYQLLSERPEVATGIIRVLTRLLRARVHDLSQLEGRIKELEQTSATAGSASVSLPS